MEFSFLAYRNLFVMEFPTVQNFLYFYSLEAGGYIIASVGIAISLAGIILVPFSFLLPVDNESLSAVVLSCKLT